MTQFSCITRWHPYINRNSDCKYILLLVDSLYILQSTYIHRMGFDEKFYNLLRHRNGLFVCHVSTLSAKVWQIYGLHASIIGGTCIIFSWKWTSSRNNTIDTSFWSLVVVEEKKFSYLERRKINCWHKI